MERNSRKINIIGIIILALFIQSIYAEPEADGIATYKNNRYYTSENGDFPISIEPVFSSSPITLAGLNVAIRTASTSGTSTRFTIVRTQESIVEMLPPSIPSGRVATPARMVISRFIKVYFPSGKPAASIASVISTTRSGPTQRYRIFIAAG